MYKVIPKEDLTIYKILFEKHKISFRTFPLSFNQQKEYTKECIKIQYSFIHLKQQLDFTKDLRIYTNRFKT